MKTRILGMAVVLGTLWAWAPGCSQAPTECTIGSASAYPYTAKFTMVSATDPAGACAGIPGDVIGMQAYNPPGSDQKPDTSKKLLAIQSTTMGSQLFSGVSLPGTCPPPNDDGSQDQGDPAVDQDPNHKPYALGEFTAIEPDGNDFCSVPKMQMAELDLPDAVDCEDPMQTTIEQPRFTETWSNVNIYVTAAALGNQAEADMTFTVDDCSAQYHVVALWPTVSCETLKLQKPSDATGMTACDPGTPGTCVDCDPSQDAADCEDLGTCCDIVPQGLPNDALCDDQPDGSPYDLPFGSGISPDLNVKCDPDLLLCVLNASSIPAFK